MSDSVWGYAFGKLSAQRIKDNVTGIEILKHELKDKDRASVDIEVNRMKEGILQSAGIHID